MLRKPVVGGYEVFDPEDTFSFMGGNYRLIENGLSTILADELTGEHKFWVCAFSGQVYGFCNGVESRDGGALGDVYDLEKVPFDREFWRNELGDIL